MPPSPDIAVIGAGPAGLMAAEILATAGLPVTVFDRMPSPGRKLLMAGRGGLNLTHSEPIEGFLGRYGAAREWLEPAIRTFGPEALVGWAEGLGQECFTGSSGRVFPKALKASPLLRAWLVRLEGLGVRMEMRAHWTGWDDAGALCFEGMERLRARAVVLALGGASWPKLGSDGGWTALLEDVATLRPSNCGFSVAWSELLRGRFAGAPLKRIALGFEGRWVRGEAVVTASGIEGGAVYALSGPIREAIAAGGPVVVRVDLRPDLTLEALAARLAGDRRGQSLSNFLRKAAGLPPVAIGLVQEALHAGATESLAELVKGVPVTLLAPAGLERAISSAGGVRQTAVDARFMLRARPGVFVAGEMLDWEAPTGGYLLQGCFATGAAAARGVLEWLAEGEA
jgi:uncharacterized flavoprotein (TIGR03862 family)